MSDRQGYGYCVACGEQAEYDVRLCRRCYDAQRPGCERTVFVRRDGSTFVRLVRREDLGTARSMVQRRDPTLTVLTDDPRSFIPRAVLFEAKLFRFGMDRATDTWIYVESGTDENHYYELGCREAARHHYRNDKERPR